MVTVCVGLCSDEGAVLVADSQITYGNLHKNYGPKITFTGNKRFSVGLAGAGYKDLMDLGFEEIGNALGPIAKPKSRPTTEKIRQTIQEEIALLAGLYPDEIKEQEWLCAIACPPSRVKFIRFWKHLPAPTQQLAIIGCGKSPLSDHLGSWITQKPSTNAEALRWAVFIIMQASKFVPGCGGPINALIFTRDARVHEKRTEETAQIEAELKELHDEFSDTFRRVAIAKPNKTETDIALKAFGGRVARIISQDNT